jgi:N-methylhydantoinase A
MGGTSTDVSLVNQAPRWTNEAQVGGFPIRIPVLDIHTIGAGGGSLAYVDAGGALRVGPQSAGADPGPACYGRGNQPTVTDANLVLGRLAPDYFLGGQIMLDSENACRTVQSLGASIGLDIYQTAQGVIDVVNAHMERALRVISVERGIDPRPQNPVSPVQNSINERSGGYILVCFGGAGGLHAADLARRAGIASVLVPPMASTLSAFGMLAADAARDYMQTVMLPGSTTSDQIAARLELLAERGRLDLEKDGISVQDISIVYQVDMRYLGQSYELSIPFSAHLQEDFHHLHQETYGYSRPGAPLEIVNLRVRAVGHVDPPVMHPLPTGGKDPSGAYLGHRPVFIAGALMPVPFFQGELLQPGNHLTGPAIIIRADTTVLLNTTDRAWVDAYANLLITVGSGPV